MPSTYAYFVCVRRFLLGILCLDNWKSGRETARLFEKESEKYSISAFICTAEFSYIVYIIKMQPCTKN